VKSRNPVAPAPLFFLVFRAGGAIRCTKRPLRIQTRRPCLWILCLTSLYLGIRAPPPSQTFPVTLKAGHCMSTSTPPRRYLALDVGSKRIGVAVSDELGLTAQPVLTLERRRNPREDLRSLARLARRYAVAGIVVGNPL